MKKLLILILLISFFIINCNKKYIPSYTINIPNYIVKPSILSENNKTLTYSKVNYFVYLHIKYIKECKYDNKCSILNNLSKILKIDTIQILKKNLNTRYIYITKTATKKDFEKLKNLKIPPVFDHIHNIYLKPIFIDVSCEKRIYPYKNILTPAIGVNRWCCGKLKGLNGLEKLVKNKPLYTTINIKEQVDLEKEADNLKQKYNAKEILAISLNLTDNKIKAIASSNRYNPSKIKDIVVTNININRYLFKSDKLLNPVKEYMEKTDETNFTKVFKKLHLFEASSDLPNETVMKIENFINKKNFTIDNIKLNFIQTTKLYSAFINGYMQKLSVLKNNNYKKEKILKIKIPLKQVVYLDFDRKTEKGLLMFKKEYPYLKGYFIIGIK